MKAVVLTEGARHELLEVPTPDPGPDEIRLRVEASGICGTDLHIMHGQFASGTGRPLIMGHEFAGTVDAVGEDVADFAPGDRVAADPNTYCQQCEWCERGAYNLCLSWGASGITVNGALAEYVCVPARFAVRLPDSVSAVAGALIEPLSCAIHAFDLSDVRDDAATVIFGGGMIGLTCLALARQLGHRVSVVELHEERRQLALELGADEVVASGDELSAAEFDYVIEATGVPVVIEAALTKLGTRGTLMQLGVAPPDFELKIRPQDVFQRELRIIGSFSVANAYAEAAEMMVALAPVLERLVTHRFGLDRFDDALAAMSRPDALKVHLEPHLNEGATTP